MMNDVPPRSMPRIVRPDDSETVPVVVSVPHAGEWIPPEERSLYALSEKQLLRDVDRYVDRLYEGAAEQGATVVSTSVHRYVVDPNRLADDIAPEAVDGGAASLASLGLARGGSAADGYFGQRGLIWIVTTRGERIYRQPIEPTTLRHRIERYYEPYHAALSDEVRRLKHRFGSVVLLDAHSMPSRATSLHPDPGASRADVVPGDLVGHSCDPELTERVAAHWRAAGYDVAVNEPYIGGGIIRRHGNPDAGVHAIQVELNRRLYMDEASLLPLARGRFDRIQRDCLDLVDAIAGWILGA